MTLRDFDVTFGVTYTMRALTEDEAVGQAMENLTSDLGEEFVDTDPITVVELDENGDPLYDG